MVQRQSLARMDDDLNGADWESDFDGCYGYNDRWWAETRRMVNKGFSEFCKKRGMEERIDVRARHNAMMQHYVRRKQRLQARPKESI